MTLITLHCPCLQMCLSILPNRRVIFQMHSSKMLEREEQIFILCVSLSLWVGFPSGSDGKESAFNKGDLGLIPGSGRSPRERNGNPLQYGCLENSMDRGACWATFSPWGHRVGQDWVNNTFTLACGWLCNRLDHLGSCDIEASVLQDFFEWKKRQILRIWDYLLIWPRHSSRSTGSEIWQQLCIQGLKEFANFLRTIFAKTVRGHLIWYIWPHMVWGSLHSVQFSSVAQSCLNLCDPMNCSTPGLPIYHQLLEFTQTHIYRVSDAIQPCHPPSCPSPPAPNPSQHQSLFQWVSSSHEAAKVLDFQL